MIDICKDVCPCNQCETEPEECELAKAYVKQIPKIAELIEPFGKFKCPSCGEMYDACYNEETGEPQIWFNHCPECGQAVLTKEATTADINTKPK